MGREQLLMSWINVAQTFYILANRNSLEAAEEFLTRLRFLPIRLILQDHDGIVAAARIKAANAVSFGDAFRPGSGAGLERECYYRRPLNRVIITKI